MSAKKRVAVCGAGRGGMTMAADLTLMGHAVSLFQLPQFGASLEPIYANHGITIKGHTASGQTGTVMPQTVTTDPAEALAETDIVMIVCPVFGHEVLMKTLAPHLHNGQVVVFNTGYWASLRFQPLIRSMDRDVTLCETMALIYLAFSDGPAAVQVHATKGACVFAAMPAVRTDTVLPRLQSLYPQFTRGANIIECNLKNGNPFFHMPIALLNAGLIDRLQGRPFFFYRDGATRRVCAMSWRLSIASGSPYARP